jgi:hypothetical protein
MAGELTEAGLVIKQLTDIRTELDDLVRSAFGPATPVSDDSNFGKLNGVFAQQESEVWELMQQQYDSMDPDQAEGAQLDNLGGLIGVDRLPATFSTGSVTFTGDANTVIPEGTTVRVSATDARFVTTAEVTLPDTGAPAGTETVAAAIQGETTGALVALSTTIDELVDVVSGVLSVSNALDIVVGRAVETDVDYRGRIENSKQIVGSATDQAIRARLLDEVSNIQSALVLSNRTLVTDANGIPGKAFLTVVHPATIDGEEVVTVLYENAPAGIEAYGAIDYSITDEQGFSQTFSYSTATELLMYIECNLTTGAEYPADGDAQVAAILLAQGNMLSVGGDVLIWKFIAALDGNDELRALGLSGVPGIITVDMRIETIDPPTNTSNIAVGVTQIAVFDSGRIEVNPP